MKSRRRETSSTTTHVAWTLGRQVRPWSIFTALLLAVAAAFAATSADRANNRVPLARPVYVHGFTLSAATNICPAGRFCISGDVQGLSPGTTKPLTLTLTNPNPFPIYATQLGGTAGTSPSGCDGAHSLTVSSWNATSTPNAIPADAITVAPASSSGPGTATRDVNVTFNDLGASAKQDNCLKTSVPLTYNGNAIWYGNCITGKQSGGVKISGTDVVCLTQPADVSGGITIAAGGTLIANPGTTVSGGIKTTGGPTQVNLCGASVSGGVSILGASGPVQIGASQFCPGNTISGGLTLTNNRGTIKVVGNNVSGGIAVSGNTSSTAPVISGNTISGGLTCTSNVPSPTTAGSPNTGKPAGTGQCAGSF